MFTVAALAGGSWIFLGFMIVMFFGVVFGYYTQKGSGIYVRNYGKVYSGAPGAREPGSASGHDGRTNIRDLTHGTR